MNILYNPKGNIDLGSNPITGERKSRRKTSTPSIGHTQQGNRRSKPRPAFDGYSEFFTSMLNDPCSS